MKDYSLNDIERKDFILNYKVTKDGKIIVRLAKGEPLILPYNKHNEQILINTMEEQVKRASTNESKYIENKDKHLKWLYRMIGSVILSTFAISISDISIIDSVFGLLFSVSTIYGVVNAAYVVHINNVLDDLKKSKRFLEIKDKVNTNIRSNQNILVNVSSYTRDAIKKSSDNQSIFNINSFDKFPNDDLETIVYNLERNERYGFDYTEPKKSRGPVRKKTR